MHASRIVSVGIFTISALSTSVNSQPLSVTEFQQALAPVSDAIKALNLAIETNQSATAIVIQSASLLIKNVTDNLPDSARSASSKCFGHKCDQCHHKSTGAIDSINKSPARYCCANIHQFGMLSQIQNILRAVRIIIS